MPHTTPPVRCMLKEYRRRKKLSQDDLARLVGIRRQAVYDMESGRYLPNTAVALKLARALGCTVEMLFAEESPGGEDTVRLLGPDPFASSSLPARLALARVGDTLVGVPMRGREAMPPCLRPCDGLLEPGNRVELLLPNERLEKTVLILGCDPALSLLGEQLARASSSARAHSVFASSRGALQALAEGCAHMAGTHFHSRGGEANLEAVRALVPGRECLVTAFSLQEEGLMVASGNPLGIRDADDLAGGRARIVNREEGAALRKLLDDRLAEKGIPPESVAGYDAEVRSHGEGAFHVACKTADAALGLRVVAEAFGLDFVPLAATRCDLVIPLDMRGHPGVDLILNMLQSAKLRKELQALPGYDASLTGDVIA